MALYTGYSYENVDACRGATEVTTAILDELALAPSSLLPTLVFCMRGTVNGKAIVPHLYGMTTPKSSSWLNAYVKDNIDNIELIRATTADNTFISQEQLDLMKSTCVDESMLRQELYGELVEASNAGQIFTSQIIESAKNATSNSIASYAIGIDCAGLGNDSNVVLLRQGNTIKEIIKIKIATAAELANTVKNLVSQYSKDKLSHIAIDEAYGLDLYNRLVGILPSNKLHLVAFGSKPINTAYSNKRTEMYINLKEAMINDGLIGLDNDLADELKNTCYKLNNQNKIALIPKKDIKINIGHSPDTADALALTFAYPLTNSIVVAANKSRQAWYMMD